MQNVNICMAWHTHWWTDDEQYMNPSFCNANFTSAIINWNCQKYKQKKNFTENFDKNFTLISKSVTLTLYQQQQQQNVVNCSVVI